MPFLSAIRIPEGLADCFCQGLPDNALHFRILQQGGLRTFAYPQIGGSFPVVGYLILG